MRFTLVILGALFCLSAQAQNQSSENSSDDNLVQEAEKLVAEDAASKAGTVSLSGGAAASIEQKATASTENIAVPESEIPVLTDSKKAAKSETNLVWRLIASLVVVAAVGGALVFATKRMGTKKNIGGAKTRIEILHQVHLGPKRTLSLVRVAGEVMLLGVTDQSINLMKSVVLIDEELESTMNTDFNKFLSEDFAIEDIRTAISSRA